MKICESCDCKPAVMCLQCAEGLAERSAAELAAPDLLAACEALQLAAQHPSRSREEYTAWQLMGAAIAKAKGTE